MKLYQYRAIHIAIVTVWGKACKCELCNGEKKSKRFEWSSKNHKYTFNKRDWWQLCAKCHRQYDAKKFGKVAWNKGRKGKHKNHNTSGLNTGVPWNKGKKEDRPEIIAKLSNSKIGKIPWNKGIKYKQKEHLKKENLL